MFTFVYFHKVNNFIVLMQRCKVCVGYVFYQVLKKIILIKNDLLSM